MPTNEKNANTQIGVLATSAHESGNMKSYLGNELNLDWFPAIKKFKTEYDGHICIENLWLLTKAAFSSNDVELWDEKQRSQLLTFFKNLEAMCFEVCESIEDYDQIEHKD